jgi:NADH-quinone oxidoreductase subunit C
MILEKILKEQQDNIISSNISNYVITFNIAKKNAIEMINYLKELGFNLLTDLTAIDYPENEERFELIYNFLNIFENQRIILKFSVKDQIDVETITDLYSAAAWYEREIWDMFGIKFKNNKDMRRILTDYEFEGHPLRKDFPLTGFKEVRYDETQKKVIYEPVKLQQDFRNFDFSSPWEGPKYDK